MQIVSVSVVIPCYRCINTIDRAVESILLQTSIPEEIILVDDCSNDGTLLKLRKIQDRLGSHRVKVVAMKQNGGPGSARNAGWDIAKNEYIAFLDADDAWHPEKLAFQYAWMQQNRQYVMTGHALKRADLEADFITIDKDVIFKEVTKSKLLSKNFFSTQTMMVRKDLPIRFKDKKKYSEDYLLACTIMLNGNRCAVSDVPLAYLYKEAYGAGGLSGNLLKMEKGELEVYEILYKDDLIGPFEYMFFSMFSIVKFLKRCAVVFFRKLKPRKI